MKRNNINKIKQRVVYLDNAAGLLVAWMMFFHICQMSDCPDLTQGIYGVRPLYFFMSWFFFKAGMFFCTEQSISVIANRGGVSAANPMVCNVLYVLSYTLYKLLGTWRLQLDSLCAYTSKEHCTYRKCTG